MALRDYEVLEGSEHRHPDEHQDLNAADPNELITLTLIVRRRAGTKRLNVADFVAGPSSRPTAVSRAEFASTHGADANDLTAVRSFARDHNLQVVETNEAARSVVIRGTVAAVNSAFAVQLHDYGSPRGKYRGHAGSASVPAGLAGVVEAVIGLDSRKVPAQHFSTARRRNPADPSNTAPVTPLQVAQLYDFPAGTGAGQTIGIYEMETGGGSAGYSAQDIANTFNAFGGGLVVPKIIDVSVDGVLNSGVSDGETGLDITVAGAIAQAATIAVYFTGGETQSIVHALQRMIHPGEGDPVPTVISISYGLGPDDATANSFSDAEYEQIDQLFGDAAKLAITVLVSSGDSGAFVESKTQAQTSYPSSEPWVLACGGTTIGNVSNSNFDEFAWNDTGKGGPGASGGGVSARFPVPSYQGQAGVPPHLTTGNSGRGVPDIAGNASENSGYVQFINGQSQPVGGTSAVAPLYAGLIARINANLGHSVGFINPALYTLEGTAFRDIVSPPGPNNNSYGHVAGYSVGAGWDAVTGLGSVKGTPLQKALQAVVSSSATPTPVGAPS